MLYMSLRYGIEPPRITILAPCILSLGDSRLLKPRLLPRWKTFSRPACTPDSMNYVPVARKHFRTPAVSNQRGFGVFHEFG